jgi:hypothetical protein
MRRYICVALAAFLLLAMTAVSASASGPAAPGKEIIQINCAGLGDLFVSVQRGENSNGAGQIVGQQGHGIPVSITFTVTDVTTSEVVFSDSETIGNGHAHSNQATIACSATQFEGAASDFFGSELPQGVSATDTIRATLDVDVIVKP